MNKQDAAAELAFIKKVIDDSRKITRDDGIFHIIWGATITCGSIFTWFLNKLSYQHYLGYLWAAIYLIAFSMTFLHVRKTTKRSKTLASGIYGYIWFSVGISAMIICFLGIITTRLSLKPALAMISMLLAGAYHTSSRTADYKWMRLVAGGWWLCAIIIIFIPESYAYLVCTAATFLLEFVCGLYLRFFLYNRGDEQ